MKNKILGMAFLLSALVAGGGIDSGSMAQFWIASIIGVIAGGVIVCREMNNI